MLQNIAQLTGLVFKKKKKKNHIHKKKDVPLLQLTKKKQNTPLLRQTPHQFLSILI